MPTNILPPHVTRDHVMLIMYTAVHVCLTTESAIHDLPFILAGQSPPDHTDNLGSQNYSPKSRPKAIAISEGYTDKDINSMRNAIKAIGGLKEVPWLRAKGSTQPKKAADELTDSDIDASGKSAAESIKEVLGEWHKIQVQHQAWKKAKTVGYFWY